MTHMYTRDIILVFTLTNNFLFKYIEIIGLQEWIYREQLVLNVL
jgi:hypothetical protein